jgi:hypothetical protein
MRQAKQESKGVGNDQQARIKDRQQVKKKRKTIFPSATCEAERKEKIEKKKKRKFFLFFFLFFERASPKKKQKRASTSQEAEDAGVFVFFN